MAEITDDQLRLLEMLQRERADKSAVDFERAAKAGATGGAFAGLPGALISAGLSVATPFVSKALGGLFGVTDAEEEERRAIERAKQPFKQVAEGGTTQGQAGIGYARGRAIQDLQAQASRGTAQQQAGLQRAAMQQGADVQAQYAAQLAELRSREQERARAALGELEQMDAMRAARSAQRQRLGLSKAIEGAITPLAQQILTPKSAAEIEADRLKESAKMGFGAQPASGELTGDDVASALGMAAPAVAPVVAGVGAAVAGAGPAAGAAPANEIEAQLAAQDQSLASLDPSVRAAMGPSAADIEQSGLAAFGGVPDPTSVSGRNRLVTGNGIARGTRMVPVTASEQAMKLQSDQENLANLQAGRSSMGSGIMSVRSAIPKISSGGGRDFETQNLQLASDIRPASEEPTQAQMAPLTTAGFPTSPAMESVEALRQKRQNRMPRSMKRVPGGGGFGVSF